MNDYFFYDSQYSWRHLSELGKINISDYKLFSLDIFDTILHRAVKVPQDLFLEVGRRAVAEGLLDSAMTAAEFAFLRAEMEKTARKKKSEIEQTTEVSFTEIWQQAPGYLLNLQKLAALELTIELELSFSNPYLFSLISELRKKRKKIVFTSDTYFEQHFIIQLFEKAGITVSDTELLLSNERKVDKAGGKLFSDLLLMHSDIKPAQILHIGDNLVSDSVQADKLGITSIYLANIHRRTEYIQRHLLLGSSAAENPLSTLYRLGNAREPLSESNFFRHFGAAVYGPVLASFCLWIVADARRRGIKLICPIMREARVFTPLLKAIAAVLGTDIEVKDFYISRKAAFLPAMEELNKDAIAHFFTRRHFTLSDLVAELTLPDLPAELQEYSTVLLSDIDNTEILYQYLYSDAVQYAARETSYRARELLVKYASSIFEAESAVAMVDLGPQGNTLRWLADCLGNAYPVKMNYLMYSTPELARNAKIIPYMTYFPVSAKNTGKHQLINRSPEALEVLLTGRDATTVGYQDAGANHIEPVTQRVVNNNAQEIKLTEFWNGVEIAMRHLKHIVSSINIQCLTNLSCRNAALNEINALLELPTFTEASELGALLFDDNAGSTKYVTICSDSDFKELEHKGRASFMLQARQKWGHRGGGVRWPQAVITQRSPEWLTQQRLASFNDTEFQFLCLNVVRKAKEAGFSDVIIYGAGQLGYQMITVAQTMGLEVKAVVDSNHALHGLQLCGYPIISLQDAAASFNHCYLIASAAFASQIMIVIKNYYQEIDVKNLTIFSCN